MSAPGRLVRVRGPHCHPHRAAWLISCSNGENRIDTREATQSEAWLQAVAQARTLGMLDGGCRFLLDRRSSAPDTQADFKSQPIPANPNPPLEQNGRACRLKSGRVADARPVAQLGVRRQRAHS
jgi:hypothetical protein